MKIKNIHVKVYTGFKDVEQKFLSVSSDKLSELLNVLSESFLSMLQLKSS